MVERCTFFFETTCGLTRNLFLRRGPVGSASWQVALKDNLFGSSLSGGLSYLLPSPPCSALQKQHSALVLRRSSFPETHLLQFTLLVFLFCFFLEKHWCHIGNAVWSLHVLHLHGFPPGAPVPPTIKNMCSRINIHTKN